jgi:hypothetical protein
MPTHTWAMATRMARHHLLPHGGYFWHQDNLKGTHDPSPGNFRRTLHGDSGLDMITLLWNQHQLGLHKQNRQSQHAQVHPQGAHQVPTSNTRTSPTSTIKACPHSIWLQNSEGGN